MAQQNTMTSPKKSSSKDAVRLKLWFFRFGEGDEAKVTVDGYVPMTNDDGEEILRNWGTNEITKRIRSDLLESASGAVYKLEGPVDEKEALKKGFPASLISRFRNGFPKDWQPILTEFFKVFKATNPLNASVWFEKTYGAGGNTTTRGERRSSISRRRSVAFADETNGGGEVENVEKPVRSRRSRLSTVPTVAAVIEERSFELDETKDKENTPKNKALTGVMDSEGGLRRSPRLLAICDTPHSDNLAQKGEEKPIPMATLEVVETPRRGPPPQKTVYKPAKLVIDEDALIDDVTPARGSKPQQQKKTSPVVNQTPSKKTTPRGGKKTVVEKEPTPAPKSTPRRRSGGDSIRETTPMPNSTPRKRASTVTDVSPAVAPLLPKKNSPKFQIAPSSSTQASETAEKEVKPILIDAEKSVIARSRGRPPKRASSAAFAESLAPMDDPTPPLPNPDDSLFKVPISVPKAPITKTASLSSGAGGKKVLLNWWIHFATNMEGKIKNMGHPPFTLAGIRSDFPEGSEVWYTNVITRVVENASSSSAPSPDFTFYTMSGSAYAVTGELNVQEMALEGFSRDFMAKFFHGFPADWNYLLWEEYTKYKDENPGLVEVPQKTENRERVVEAEERRGAEPIVTHPSSDSESMAPAPASVKNKEMMKKSKSMADVSNLSVVPFDKRRLSSGSGGELVKTSSRGRTIKERMRVRYSDRGEVLGVENISIHESLVDPFAEHYAVPHSSQNRRISAQPPRLSIEMDGRQRVLPKKRLVDYESSSSSSSDDDVVLRTVRHIDYNQMNKPQRPGAKRSRMEEESDDEKMILKRIDKKEKKAQKVLVEMRKARLRLMQKRETRKEHMLRQAQMTQRDEEFERRQYALEQKLRAQKLAQKKRFQPSYQQQKKRPSGRAPQSAQRKKRHVVVEEDSSDEDSVGFDGMNDGGTSDDVSEESSTTETEVSDGGEWERTPAQKKKAVKRTKRMTAGRKKKTAEKRRKSVRKDEEEEEEEESEEEEQDEDTFEQTVEPVVKAPKEPKQKKPTWRQDDLDRLKLALKAMKVRSDEDWEKISNSLGNKFDAADCHEVAVKKLKWTPPQEEATEKAEIVVTARKGTQAYQVQAEQQTRKFMMGGGSQEDDCFRNENTTEDSGEFEMPNVAEFDPDDSLLAALKTPTVAAGGGRKGASRKPYIAAPIFGDDDTPTRTTRRSSAMGIHMEEPDSAERENQQRYLHRLHLMQKDKSRLNNTTRLNNTSMFMNTTAADRSRAVDKFSRKLEKIEKATKRQTKKKQREFDEEDEMDEEEEEDC